MLKQQADTPWGGGATGQRRVSLCSGHLEEEKWSLGEWYQSSKQNLCWVVMKEEEEVR